MAAEYALKPRIAGDQCEAARGEWFEKLEPCTGRLFARVPAGTGVDLAVRAPCALRRRFGVTPSQRRNVAMQGANAQ